MGNFTPPNRRMRQIPALAVLFIISTITPVAHAGKPSKSGVHGGRSTIEVSISASPSSGAAPLNVSFTPSVKLSAGYATDYYWSFGDGQTSTSALPVHVYQNAGTYTATLSVTDSAGGKSGASMLIGVTGGASFSD